MNSKRNLLLFVLLFGALINPALAKKHKKKEKAEQTEQTEQNDGLHHETRDKKQAKAQSKPTKSTARPELEVDTD